MDINKKYIIIFGTLILLLVIITGAITYYKEKEPETKIPDITQVVLGFSQDYPTNFDELSDFINSCKNTVFPDTEGLKNNKGIKEIVCAIERGAIRIVSNGKIRSVSAYIPSFSTLDSIVSFKSGKYLSISVDAEDVIREYDPSLLEEDELYFCSISAPSLTETESRILTETDSLILQLIPNKILTFDEGNIFCTETEMNKTPSMVFSGFIPKAESLNIKQYLVNEQIASNVMNKQSFSEIKEILNDYPIVWQMEKPIIP